MPEPKRTSTPEPRPAYDSAEYLSGSMPKYPKDDGSNKLEVGGMQTDLNDNDEFPDYDDQAGQD